MALLTLVASAGSADAATLTPYATSSPAQEIVTGPDGNLWFTESGTRVGTITTGGTLHEYSTGLTSGAELEGIAVLGSDVWFTEPNKDEVGEISTTNDTISEFSTGISSGAEPTQITAGPDGDLWFTEPGIDSVAKINPTTHLVTQYGALSGISAGSAPTGITAGPDGNLWFTEAGGDAIGEITTAGVATEYPLGSAGSDPLSIVTGPDGALWFTEGEDVGGYRYVGRITTAGGIAQLQLPYSDSASTENQIALAPGGKDLMFSESYNGQQGDVDRLTTLGLVGSFPAPNTTSVPDGLTAGPDGNIWIATNGGIDQLALGTPPSATTTAPSSITETQANLNGTLTPSGSDTEYVFEFGRSNTYGSLTYVSDGGSGTSASDVSVPVTGLSPGITYHYQLLATSIDGDATGGDQNLPTSAGAIAPTVTTLPADTVTATTANINATINPNGARTTYHFEWGTSTSYGNTVPIPDGTLSAATTPQNVSVALSGLPSGSVIHYRIDATNSVSTSDGNDQTLTTFTSVPAGQIGADDSSFGTNGETTFSFGSTSFNAFNAIARDASGNLVLAGYSDQTGGPQWAIARVTAGGSSDASFGDNGFVLLNVGGAEAAATGVAIQANGQIVVAGNTGSGGEIVRLNSNGSLDTSFGSGGTVTLPSMSIAAVAVQPSNQRIVVAGAESGEFALTRLTTDGSMDTTFGTGGTVTTTFPSGASAANALAIESDGELLAAGHAASTFAVAVYQTDGALDTSFGTNGLATPATPGSGPALANVVGIGSQGQIVLGGSDGTGAGDTAAAVVQLKLDGANDDSFGSGGVSEFTVPGTADDSVAGLAIDTSGEILVAGNLQMDGGQNGFVAALAAGGATDTAFGESGLITNPQITSWNAILAPATSGPNTTDLAVAGIDPEPDTPQQSTADTGGIIDKWPTSVTTELSSSSGTGQSLTVQQDQSIEDTATIHGLIGSASAQGTVSFEVIRGECSSNGGATATAFGAIVNGAMEKPVTIVDGASQSLTPGTYYVEVIYTGDDQHLASSNCDESFTIAAPPPPATDCTQKDQTCSNPGAACTGGSVCTGTNGACQGAGTICTGTMAVCTNDATCTGADDSCHLGGALCTGTTNACDGAARCSGTDNTCNGARTMCTGTHDECTDSAMCTGRADICQGSGAVCACPEPPPTVSSRYEADVATAADKGFNEFDLQDVKRAIARHITVPGVSLAAVAAALHSEVKTQARVPSPDFATASEAITPATAFPVAPTRTDLAVRRPALANVATVGISKDNLDSCVDGLIDYTNDFTASKGIKGKSATEIKTLVSQLMILKDLLDPEKNKKLKPEDKKKILEDALIALTKEFGGEKAGELTGEGATLFELLSGQLSKKEQDKAFKDSVKKLAKKLVGKDAGDLADQIFTLVDVLQGNIDEEKAATILQQSVIGLLTRLGGKGLLDMPQIRAFVTGYQLMQPFAAFILQNLVVIVNRGVYTRCLTELEAAAQKNPTVTYPGPGISTGPWTGNPTATEGWSCATYMDSDTGMLAIQAVSPSGGWVILYDAGTGQTLGQRGGP